MRKLFSALLLFPVIVVVAGWLRPDLVVGDDLMSHSGFWTILGTTFSYLGFVFSLFAVMEVRALSDRYFAKQRIPEIKKRIDSITRDVKNAAELEFAEIRTQKFMSEIPVMIRQVQRTKVGDLKPAATLVEKRHEVVRNHIKTSANLNTRVNNSNAFWDLYGSLTELSDEIGEYQKGALASL